MPSEPVIAIVGGTGALGSGLAKRWAAAGMTVILGSRSEEKAKAAAKELAEGFFPAASLFGADNLSAAKAADIVVLSVPFASHDETLEEIRDGIRDKILIDAVVPLVPPKVSVVQLPPHGSAAQMAQKKLDGEAIVVSAFHNISASKLHKTGPVDCDILVFGDDKSARETVVALADKTGGRGVDGGVLANSVAAEALTCILIGISRRYKLDGAGIRITGLPSVP